MDVLIKLVVLGVFLLARVYRLVRVWRELEEINGVKCQPMIDRQTTYDLYEANGGLKLILAVVSLIAFFIQPFSLISIVGVAIFLAALMWAIVARRTLGRSWADLMEFTVTREPLVMSGPYRCCRNPIYAGLFLEWISFVVTFGWPLMLEPLYLILLLVTAVKSFFIYHKVVLAEERFLTERYGEQYQRYMASTPRYLPISFRLVFKPKPIL